MKSRQLIIVAGIALLLGGLFLSNYIASFKESSVRKPPPPAIRSTEFVTVKNAALQARIPVTGKLVAKDKIEIYAEVTGNLLSSSANFKEGNRFNQGVTLISIDNSELRLSIQSAKSNFLSVLTRVLPDLKLDYPDAFPAWKNYTDAFSVTKPLPSLPELKGREKYFLSTQGVLNQYYSIKSQEARLAKYTIEAPFSGTVSSAAIKPGTLVRVGQKLGEFIKTGVYEMEVSIDLSHLPFAAIGSEVKLTSSQVSGEFVGKVTRISDALDPNTQSAKVILEVVSDKLKEGMYLDGAILTDPFENVFILKKNQLTEQNLTYLIVDGRLQARKITPLFVGEDEVVTADLKDGDRVLQNIYNGAFDGARVRTEGDQESAGTPATENQKGSKAQKD